MSNGVKFSMNMARTLVGRHVNIHLKDGSVILNVKVITARNQKGNGGPNISYKTSKHNKLLKIPLKEIAWTEQLNPYLTKKA